MADLTAAQSEGLVQRQSLEDLKTIVLVLQRDGSLNGDFVDPIADEEDGEAKAAAEAARDDRIEGSLLFAEATSPAPTEEELSGNLQAAEDAGETEEAAPAPAAKSTKAKASASAEGA